MESSTPPQDSARDKATEKGSTKKRRPTEKRKLQNRIAQRKYRENLKSRLENLGRQAAEIQEGQNANPDANINATSQPEVTDSVPDVTEAPIANVLEESIFDFLLDMNPDGGDQNVLVDTGDFEFPNYPIPMFPNMDSIFDTSIPPESTPSSSTQDSGTSFSTRTDADFEYDLYISQLITDIPTPKDPPNQFSQVREEVPWAPCIPSRPWPSGKSPIKTIDNFVRLVPSSNTISKMTIHGHQFKSTDKLINIVKVGTTFSHALVQQLRLNDSKENKSLVQTAIARGYNIRDVFLAGLSALDRKESLAPRIGFDPYKNTLTLVRTSTLQAFLSNAMALNISFKELKKQDFPSPFYQPEAFPSGTSEPLRERWDAIPNSLQPVNEQIIMPHHPWIDMLPFPTIRERVLRLSTMDPPMIDVCDFKNDVFLNSGLFCWRVGGTEGTGQPWDKRSWEAEPWFLRKWWVLVGGVDGDVWLQTQWWRCMRGIAKVEMDGVSR